MKSTTNIPSSAVPPRSSGTGDLKFTPHPFMCIWNGLSISGLWRLLATKPPINWGRLHKVVPVLVFSILNTQGNFWESLIYGKKIERQSIDHSPIFILGHWRSGTTLLHNLMTLDSQFTFPNLYQVTSPGHFLFTEGLMTRLFGWMIPKIRPMDNMEFGFHMPQEDEFALLLLTGVSPYMMFAHPTVPLKYERYFELTTVTDAERKRWKDGFMYFVKKLTIKANKPIVFKSPTHTFRIPLLLEMFPNAKFIYIYRDPYDVWVSSIHSMKAMCCEHGFTRFVMDAKFEESGLRTYTNCMETYERTRSLIAPSNLHEVRFEDLEADPIGQMRHVYQRLNLEGWTNLEAAITKKLPELTGYRKNSFSMDEDLMRKVYSRWKPWFDRYGYHSRLPEFDACQNSASEPRIEHARCEYRGKTGEAS